MPPRQRWMFGFGSWLAIATAVLALSTHLIGPRAPVAGSTLTVWVLMPGEPLRSMDGVFDGLSLVFPLLVATLGALGVAIQKRGDRPLLLAGARMMASSGVVLLLISLTHFYIALSIAVAAMTTCFLVASVESPEA